jgi:hypothetical protein
MGRWYKQDNPQKRRLSRRAVLKGAGGVTVALPLLEMMLDSEPALAGTAPARYLVLWGGQSMGADGDPLDNLFVPDAVGAAYDLKTATQPFADYGVENEITIVSGLSIPTANGGSPPAGGRPDDFHINNMGPLITGMRSLDHDKRGPSSDQIMAELIGQTNVFQSVTYQIQAGWYLSVSAPYGRDVLSIRDGGGGDLIEIPGTVSPKQAFDTLFYNFQPSDDPAEAAAADFAWRRRKSIVDLVKRRAERLVQKLGGADQKRIERHLDEIRDLEQRISAIPPDPGGACVKPPDPGPDPSLGGNQPNVNGENQYDQNLGYSGEEERANIFMDLVHMAFTCDLTRVGAVMFTMAQSHLNMFQLSGAATDLHEIGHNGVQGGTQRVAEAQAWHMKHFAYLVDKLRDTPEGNGSVLDNCAIVWLWEGGHGNDPSTGNPNSSHSTENMCCAIAGGAGGLVRGHHVVAPPGLDHPANVIVSAMQAAGYAGDTLGEVSGSIPALFGAA